jgi:hypothetical protein
VLVVGIEEAVQRRFDMLLSLGLNPFDDGGCGHVDGMNASADRVQLGANFVIDGAIIVVDAREQQVLFGLEAHHRKFAQRQPVAPPFQRHDDGYACGGLSKGFWLRMQSCHGLLGAYSNWANRAHDGTEWNNSAERIALAP